MNPQSVVDVFQLSPAVRNGFLPFLPDHPLSLVAADNPAPKIIFGFDRVPEGRVINDVPRVPSSCTHINVTILPGMGADPVSAGFGAACLVETFRNGRFVRVNRSLAKQANELYKNVEKLPPLKKMLHPSLKEGVPGQIVDESWRIADSFMSVDLESDRQVRGALDKIAEWKAEPPNYSVRALNGSDNCYNFAGAVLDGANVPPPLWWWIKPWPGMYARGMDLLCGDQLQRSGDWLFQPREVTKTMHAAAMQNCSHDIMYEPHRRGRAAVPRAAQAEPVS